jgi:hypothetical protein
MFSFLNTMNFWIFGWAALGIFFCSTDLVQLCFGEEYVLSVEIPFVMALNFFMIGQIGSAIFMYFVAIAQSVVSMHHTVKQTKVQVWEQMLFCGLYVGLGFLGILTAPGFVPELSGKNLLELLPIVGSAMLTFSIFARSEQTTRKFLLVNASIWAVYTAIVGSTTFFAEFFAAVTTAAALWKYRKNKKPAQ